MTAVLIDSNVLLDIMTEDARWLSWSAAALEKAANTSRLVVNAIIHAEVSVRYSRMEEVETALPKGMIEREDVGFSASPCGASAKR